jgi:hypothetical protein
MRHMLPSSRRIVPVLTLAVATVALACPPTVATARDLIVRYDQSQLLRLPRPVSEIIVGNPSIASVTVQGGNMLVITGKTFGVTNVIALDADRNVIQDQRIQVSRDHHNVVHVHRGAERHSYSCVPTCSPMLSIGDDAKFFGTVLSQNRDKTRFSEGLLEKEAAQ